MSRFTDSMYRRWLIQNGSKRLQWAASSPLWGYGGGAPHGDQDVYPCAWIVAWR